MDSEDNDSDIEHEDAPDRPTAALFPPEPDADRPSYQLTEADRLLNEVYGDHYHNNPGTHLDGGIGYSVDRKWQRYWKRVVQISPRWYLAPQGRIGKRFVLMYTAELKGVRDRKWNSERPSIFPALILYKSSTIKASKDIRSTLTMRMNLWEQGRVLDLIQDLEAEAAMRGDFVRERTDEQAHRAYNSTVLSGKLRSAIRQLTDRDKGGVFAPDDKCTKTGKPVLQVLQSKHPDAREPDNIGTPGGAFEKYPNTPTCVDAHISIDVIEEISSKLSGAAGPDGVDSSALRAWLLEFGAVSATCVVKLQR